MSIITNSLRAFKAEWIKLKGTGMWWIIILASAFLPIITLIFRLTSDRQEEASNINPWDAYFAEGFNSFAFLYVLMGILIAVRICQTEHRNQGWKLIETQPIHRAFLYMAKFKMALVLLLIGLLVYFTLSIIGAYVYSFVKEDLTYRQHALPLGKLVGYILRIWISTWGLMALQYFLSIAFGNFALPFMVGFALTITGGIVSSMNLYAWVPYGAPFFAARSFSGSITGSWLLHQEKLSIAWMFIFLWIGYQYYFNRSAKYAFLSGKQALKIGAAAIVFAVLFIFIEKPVSNQRNNKTVIAGKIEGARLSDKMMLINVQLMDTVMEMPFRDGYFYGVYKGDSLEAGYYALSFGNRRIMLFMGQDDSIYIKWNLEDPRPPEISGTRIAENDMRNNWVYQDYMGAMHKMKPDAYGNFVLDQWNRDMRDIDHFKTVDNIRPSPDFITLKKKQTTISYLQALKIDYPKLFSMYHPGDTLKYPSSVDTILNTLSANDPTMLKSDDYLDYLDKEFRYSQKMREYVYDSTFFNKLLVAEKGENVKGVMLYKGLKGMINLTSDSTERNSIFNRYKTYIKDPLLTAKLEQRLALENSLIKGMPAPQVESISLAGENRTLKDLAGRYVVIDVWATWCAPCRTESPFFERYAELYGGDKISFVSLSIDDGNDVSRWQYEAVNKSKQTIQLRVKDKFDFMTKYGIESIPRFIMLDPKGNIMVLNMPRPSDRLFEEYLKTNAGI